VVRLCDRRAAATSARHCDVALCIESFSSTPVSLIRKVAGLAAPPYTLSDLAGEADLAVPLADLASEKHKRPRPGKRFEGAARLRHWRQFESQREQSLVSRPAHDADPCRSR